MRRPASSRCDVYSGVGTWLMLTVALMLLTAGASARRGGPPQPAMPDGAPPQKYNALQKMVQRVKRDLKQQFVYGPLAVKELQLAPPKPLQVFQYGPSRRAFLRNPEKYKYQYVCVVSRMGSVQEGVWHRKKASRWWYRIPPFHVRIVRPSPAGMLDYMLSTGKVKLVTKDVTVEKTDNETGEVTVEVRKMRAVERVEEKLPKRLRKALEAERKGKQWKDKRKTKGTWGPANDDMPAEKAIRELLTDAGIESKKDVASILKAASWEN